MQGAQVWSLVGELGPHMPCGMAKKKKKEKWTEQKLPPSLTQVQVHSGPLSPTVLFFEF